jgi:predicted  nucleic acid-binding Zn-ribbon protein
MVQNSYIDFTEPVVKKLEGFADMLESVEYNAEDWKVITSLFLLYIESNLNSSNIYDFVFKTDEVKDEKLSLQENKRVLFEKINDNVKFLETSPNSINEMWDQVRDHYDIISDTETKLNEEIENHYVEIKKIEEELQKRVQELYSQIKDVEINRNSIVDGEYFTIKSIESDINDTHKKMEEVSKENDEYYKEVELMDHKLSEIENYVEDSEWKVELDSPEEKVFEHVKNNLIKNKRLRYGNI